ncbi:MAG: RluA family pseudouridine synthase [Aggregatilineales bacterium]
MTDLQFTVAERGERLDKLVTTILSGRPGVEAESVSRTRVQQAIKEGLVTVNGQPSKAAYRVESGDVLSIPPLEPPISTWVVEPEAIPLDVLYEDDSLVAIHKPAGMVVHPAAGIAIGTLVNAVLARWPQTAQVGSLVRAGIVHRLDKDTSGVIVIAKTEGARRDLMAQFKARTVQKRYVALVYGVPATPTGQIDAPIGRDPHQRKQMAVIRDGKSAITFYKVVQSFGVSQAFRSMSYLELLPKTGRTHQLRVHLAFIKHPIVGDRVYGPRKSSLVGPLHLDRQFLHAEALSLISPATSLPITLHAPLPADLQAALDYLTQSEDNQA